MHSILLVEDNPADVEILKRHLRHQPGMTLCVASTGVEALSLLEKERFSCLLLDYKLPDTNGLKLLQTLRRKFPDLKIVFLTGQNDDRLFLGAIELGVTACVNKDDPTENLLRIIRDQMPFSGPEAQRTPITQWGLPPYGAYQTLIETMNEGVIAVDLQKIIVFDNPRAGVMAGCPAPDLLGREVTSLLSPDSARLFLEEWPRIMAGETRSYECEVLSCEALPIPVLISQAPSSNTLEKICGSLLVITDITHQKEIEKRLEQLSITDGLTGLFNRRYFQASLDAEFQKIRRYEHPLSCIMIDLDHFKVCNDSLGHLFGDHVLQEVGQLIRNEIREYDILARYGGEEFILLLPNISLEGAVEVAERIRTSIMNHTFSREGQVHRITVSIGVVGSDDARVTSPEDLIRYADTALYEAKLGGRNRISLQRLGSA